MKRRGHGRGQRFVKADYYELDWYYDECTDGKAALCSSRELNHPYMQEQLASCNRFLTLKGELVVLGFLFFFRLLLSHVQVQSTRTGTAGSSC